MTLSAPNPWPEVLHGQAAAVAELLAARGVEGVAIAAVGNTVWIAGPASDDPKAVVWRIVCEVARWWPGWLAPAGVGCVVTSGTYKVTAGPTAMVEVAETAVGRSDWLASLDVV